MPTPNCRLSFCELPTSVKRMPVAAVGCLNPGLTSDLPPPTPVQWLTRRARACIHQLSPGARVSRNLTTSSSTIATRSGLSAVTLIAALTISGASALAQNPTPTPPDTTAAQVDTTNNLVMTTNTSREVKHVVNKGDTLWDLAQTYLKNPFRWPEIFHRNTDIVKDPHWIYPGEVIRISGNEVKPEALARADSAGEVVSHVATRTVQEPQVVGGRSDLTVFASPMSRVAAATAAAAASGEVIGRGRPSPVRRGEVEAAPYADRGPRGAGRLVSSVDRPGIKTTIVQSRYQLNDALYAELPRGATARLGDRYMSYVLGPDLGSNGQVIIPTGILQIESLPAGQRPVARIVRQFAEIKLDQPLIAAPDIMLPDGTLSPVSGGPRGRVLYVHNEPVLPSIGHYVIISNNSSNGLTVGDEVTFIDNTTGRADADAAPPVVAGIGQVVRVTPFSATAIIVHQDQPTIRDGMPVRLTGKMP